MTVKMVVPTPGSLLVGEKVRDCAALAMGISGLLIVLAGEVAGHPSLELFRLHRSRKRV
jgi:hypothetical protein